MTGYIFLVHFVQIKVCQKPHQQNEDAVYYTVENKSDEKGLCFGTQSRLYRL